MAEAARRRQERLRQQRVFKTVALAQPSLNAIAEQLTRSIDFSVITAASRIAADFAARQTTWLENIGPALAAMRASFYPSNLRGIEGLKFEEVEKVVMVDGIPLYGLPRTATAEALIRATGRASDARSSDVGGRASPSPLSTPWTRDTRPPPRRWPARSFECSLLHYLDEEARALEDVEAA